MFCWTQQPSSTFAVIKTERTCDVVLSPMPLLYLNPNFLDHATGDHPESPERLRLLHRQLRSSGTVNRFTTPTWQEATAEQIQSVHTVDHVARIEALAANGGGWLDSDTLVSQRSFDVACLAVGSVIDAVDRVFMGPQRQAVCLVRPPGHHASTSTAMGFCLFNNVAVGAVHARLFHDLHRILIVDWDVHHGNGTQELFYRDHDVYYVSVHRHPFFPGTGHTEEIGAADGKGTIFNLPLPFGVSRTELLTRFGDILTTAARKCRPELVLLSAGFDAHHADPIGSLGLETEDFETLTSMTLDVAKEHCDGRLVSVLEGGYNVPVLAECVELHLQTLL